MDGKGQDRRGRERSGKEWMALSPHVERCAGCFRYWNVVFRLVLNAEKNAVG